MACENKEPIKRLKLIDSFQLCGKHQFNALQLFISLFNILFKIFFILFQIMYWICHVSQKTKRSYYFQLSTDECRRYREPQYWSSTRVYGG
jgi:hypothetical protein